MLDPERSVEELAAEIAQLPIGTDLSNVGLIGLLTGEGGIPRNPAKYTAIFEQAARAADNSWTHLACEVERINGRRRHSQAPLTEIIIDLACVSARIAAELDPGADKFLLVAGVDYNLGIVLRNLRRCREAAQYQRQSASWYMLAGRVPQAMVGQFVAAVEDASAATMDGDLPEIAHALRHLRDMRDLVQGDVDPYPVWMVRNAAIHVWHAHFLAGLLQKPLGDYNSAAVDLERVRDSKLQHWAALAKVVGLYQQIHLRRALVMADAGAALAAIGELQSSSWGDVWTTLLLLKALALSLTRRAEAKAALDEIVNWTGQGAGPVMAVARILHALV